MGDGDGDWGDQGDADGGRGGDGGGPSRAPELVPEGEVDTGPAFDADTDPGLEYPAIPVPGAGGSTPKGPLTDETEARIDAGGEPPAEPTWDSPLSPEAEAAVDAHAASDAPPARPVPFQPDVTAAPGCLGLLAGFKSLASVVGLGALVAATAGVLTFGGLGLVFDGDDGEGSDRQSEAASASPENEPAEAPAGPEVVLGGQPPEIFGFDATFSQATFSTTYTVDADPEYDFAWDWQPGERCGVFDADGPEALWTHPHQSQAGVPIVQTMGIPAGQLCKDTAQNEGGHPGVITVTVSNATHECVLVYENGSLDGSIEEAPECSRKAAKPTPAPAENVPAAKGSAKPTAAAAANAGDDGMSTGVRAVIAFAVFLVVVTAAYMLWRRGSAMAIGSGIVGGFVMVTVDGGAWKVCGKEGSDANPCSLKRIPGETVDQRARGDMQCKPLGDGCGGKCECLVFRHLKTSAMTKAEKQRFAKEGREYEYMGPAFESGNPRTYATATGGGSRYEWFCVCAEKE